MCEEYKRYFLPKVIVCAIIITKYKKMYSSNSFVTCTNLKSMFVFLGNLIKQQILLIIKKSLKNLIFGGNAIFSYYSRKFSGLDTKK